jgi:hypothetical protein
MSLLKLPFLDDFQKKLGELLLSTNFCPIIILEKSLN